MCERGVHGAAGRGEQADGARGGEVEVQAGARDGVPRQAGVPGVGLGGVLRPAAEGRSADGPH